MIAGLLALLGPAAPTRNPRIGSAGQGAA